MNKALLTNYGIEFRVVKKLFFDTYFAAFQIQPSAINYFICNYLQEMSIEIIKDDVLVELQNAVNGQPFDEDGGGFETFLHIGSLTSTFSDTNGYCTPCDIPTQDILDILNSWLKWINVNKLGK